MGERNGTATVVHVGFPKTATSWLQGYVFPKLDGIELVDRAWARKFVFDDDTHFQPGEFHQLVREADARRAPTLVFSHELICGNVFADPGNGFRNIKRIGAALPDARLLVVVRRQDEMLVALHSQYVKQAGHRSLKAFLDGRQIEGWNWDWRFLEYDRLISEYVEAFGPHRVRVIPYEFLRDHPGALMTELAEYLRAGDYAPVYPGRVNISLSRPAVALVRRVNQLAVRSNFNSRPPLGARTDGRWPLLFIENRLEPALRRLERVWPGVGDRLERVADRYAGSNRRLQRYVREPLVALGYPGL